MNRLASQNDIDRISMDILRGSKSLDIFPTPVDKIVSYTELLVRSNVDVSQIHHSYKDRANDFLKSALSKVRGIFDVKRKEIYLDLSQGFSRQNFVKLHETAHGILPWQKSVHEIIGDNDQTLNPDYNEEFESEANYFASITLFQQDRFNTEMNKLNLGIESGMHLAKHFGSSVHAALRRFVECSTNNCALLVLENLHKENPIHCFLRTFITSKKFEKEFGDLLPPSRLNFEWPFVQDYYFKKRFKKNGLVAFQTESGKVEFVYQFFNNTYNAFVFIHPVGEMKKSRTTVIIRGVESE